MNNSWEKVDMFEPRYYVKYVKNLISDGYSWRAYKQGGFFDLFVDQYIIGTLADTQEECIEKLKLVTEKHWIN